jgi:hypothetical protein
MREGLSRRALLEGRRCCGRRGRGPALGLIGVWDAALKYYAPNLGYDWGGRLMAAWLDR